MYGFPCKDEETEAQRELKTFPESQGFVIPQLRLEFSIT